MPNAHVVNADPERSAVERMVSAIKDSWVQDGKDLTLGALLMMGLAYPITAAVVVPMALWTIPMMGMAFAFLINWYIMFTIFALAFVGFAWPVGAVFLAIGRAFARVGERVSDGFRDGWPRRPEPDPQAA